MDAQVHHLLLILRAELTLGVSSADCDRLLVLGDTRFIEVAQTDFTGFYDWLRDSEQRTIGVRYHPFEDYYYLINVVTPLPYVDVAEAGTSFDIYFLDSRHVDEAASDDQSFGGNKLYKSLAGEYLITFKISEEDLPSIKRLI